RARARLGALAPSRAHLDGGAVPPYRRAARDPVLPRGRHHRPSGGPSVTRIRVVIVDDHAVVREGLRTFLDLQDGLEVVGEAGDGEEALAVIEELEPDVVLMDLVMPKLDGVGAMRALRAKQSPAKVIALTSF